MNIYVKDHSFHYEMENLVRLFYPNEKLNVITRWEGEPEKPYVLTALEASDNGGDPVISARAAAGNFDKSAKSQLPEGTDDPEKETEREMAVLLYGLLRELTGKTQPWGILTGVRPVKLFRRLSGRYGDKQAREYFERRLLVTPEKTGLCAETEGYERRILSMSKASSCSLYVSIPFCPTRCSYCSFVSQTIEKAQKLVQPYFELLCRELEYTGEIVRRTGLVMESVYVGGGTPTTLSAVQLSVLIETIRKNFDLSACREFTVEAGRPDTIDREKLIAVHSGGVDRISINPQTLNDDVLKVIGRRHSAAQTLEAFALARECGFGHINTDLIAGLPTESVESFCSTLDRICELSPESITVHTLSLKRSSRLTLEGEGVSTDSGSAAAGMLDYGTGKLHSCGYHPYYLYRQTRMEGNLENVGWSKPGFDGIYNVFVMDETHTILGCGAGAVTKLKKPGTEELERIFNYKYPYEYINGFEEMLRRKDRVIAFYDELS